MVILMVFLLITVSLSCHTEFEFNYSVHNHHDIALDESKKDDNDKANDSTVVAAETDEIVEKIEASEIAIKKEPQWSTIYGLVVGDVVHNFIGKVYLIRVSL